MSIDNLKIKTLHKKFNIFSFRKLDKNEQKIIMDKTEFLPTGCSFSERLYCFNNDINERPLCKGCKAEVTFTFWLKKSEQRYRTFCSNKCSNNCLDVKLKKENSYMKKYGVTNPSKLPEIKEMVKKKTTMKYGGVGFSSSIIKRKILNTVQNKYNVDDINKIPICLENLNKIWSTNSYRSVSKKSKEFIKKYIKLHNFNEELCCFGDDEIYIHYGNGKRYFYDLVVFKDKKSKEQKNLYNIELILEYDGIFWHPTIDQSITYRDIYFGITKIPTRELYLKDLHKSYIAKKYCKNFIRVRS